MYASHRDRTIDVSERTVQSAIFLLVLHVLLEKCERFFAVYVRSGAVVTRHLVRCVVLRVVQHWPQAIFSANFCEFCVLCFCVCSFCISEISKKFSRSARADGTLDTRQNDPTRGPARGPTLFPSRYVRAVRASIFSASSVNFCEFCEFCDFCILCSFCIPSYRQRIVERDWDVLPGPGVCTAVQGRQDGGLRGG